MTSDAFVLHRYFLAASEMREQFVSLMKQDGPVSFDSDEFPRVFTYWSLWYATLWVVVEGWEHLDFHDDRVDQLLEQEEMRKLLKRYRNGVMHFQHVEWDERVMALLREGHAAVEWIHSLHRAIGDSLLERLATSD